MWLKLSTRKTRAFTVCSVLVISKGCWGISENCVECSLWKTLLPNYTRCDTVPSLTWQRFACDACLCCNA